MTLHRGSRLRWITVAVASALVFVLPAESRADPLRFTEFSAGADSTPVGITSGPDGNLWFAEFNGGKIGRMTPSGSISEYDVPANPRSLPTVIASGSDGNLWFGYGAGNIGRITPEGAITEFAVPTMHQTTGITSGADGNLWFTEWTANKIGRITTSGSVTEFDLPTASGAAWNITSGADGALWFTNPGANTIGRITTSGSITEFGLPTASSYPYGISSGPDGNVWFTEQGKIGRITPNGLFTEFIVDSGSSDFAIAAGPDGNMWFGDRGTIGRITMGGSVTDFNIPYQGSVYGMTAGPDGNLWFTEFDSSKIARLVPPTSDLSVSAAANPSPVRHGNNMTYTVTVDNAGPDDATPVRTVQALPPEGKFVSANPSQGNCVSPAVGTTGDVTCSLGTIATGTSATIIVVVTVTAPAGSSVQSTVGADSDGIDMNPNDNSASVVTQVLPSSSDVGISISANPNPVRRNHNLTYSVFVTNTGPDAAALVQSVQQLPSESRFMSATASQGSCITPATGGTGSVTCSLGAIIPGNSAAITVVVTVTAPDRSTVLSTTTVSGDGSDPNTGNNSAQVSTRVCNLVIFGTCV